ncbi:MAG TPA: phosphatase PAP2 family protein [Thermoanaerobaculia bacterium]
MKVKKRSGLRGSGSEPTSAEARSSELGTRKRRHSFLPTVIGITGGVALATVAFWFFKKQADRVVAGKADDYDTRFLSAVQQAKTEPVDRAMHWLTQLGTHYAIGAAASVTAIAMMRQKRKHDAWTVIISTGGAMALNTALKAIFQRQRPFELHRYVKLPKSHSFPSGHSLLCAATYPIVVHHLVQHRSLPVQAVAHTVVGAMILSVGFSRIYFAVHFPSDVLAGFAAGFGWLGLTSLSHAMIDKSA